jgi:hypothetical protein
MNFARGSDNRYFAKSPDMRTQEDNRNWWQNDLLDNDWEGAHIADEGTTAKKRLCFLAIFEK